MKTVAGLTVAALIFGSAAPTQAQQPVLFDFESFCAAVESKIEENQPSRDDVRFRYQNMVYDAAGVESTDSLEIAYSKVKAFMDANQASLTCNIINFNPRNGNIYKMAVARQADDFIRDALLNWHVDLNQIDSADGKTVLDYIFDRREMAGTTSTFGRTLDRYYRQFREAGARHARELQ